MLVTWRRRMVCLADSLLANTLRNLLSSFSACSKQRFQPPLEEGSRQMRFEIVTSVKFCLHLLPGSEGWLLGNSVCALYSAPLPEAVWPPSQPAVEHGSCSTGMDGTEEKLTWCCFDRDVISLVYIYEVQIRNKRIKVIIQYFVFGFINSNHTLTLNMLL